MLDAINEAQQAISIHAPARGATLAKKLYPVHSFAISIHAPARGATWDSRAVLLHTAHFNPRTREGCDFSRLRQLAHQQEFQSTHPRGVRLHFLPIPPINSEFQSTHPRGVRPWIKSSISSYSSFQSTHPRGVRPAGTPTPPRSRRHFNPRTREGCDWRFL